MSGRSSRTKGASAEREAFGLLNEHIGSVVFRRNITQTRGGGCDSDDNPHVAIEVKRQETLALPAWIRQAQEQAKGNQLPVLMWRQSRMPWQVAVIMTPEQFAKFYKVLATPVIGEDLKP